jgi:hypothetical protein
MDQAGGRLLHHGSAPARCVYLLLAFVAVGCGGGAVGPAPQDDTIERLRKLFNLYNAYVQKQQKAPPNEAALREFGQKLTPQQRGDLTIGEDLESIFVSSRDQQKFVVQYGLKPNPAKSQALAWEATGKNGMRCVVLTMGYPAEYDEKTLEESKK